MDKQDSIQTVIDTFIDTVTGEGLTPIDTLGILSFLTGLYHHQIMTELAKEFNSESDDSAD